MNYPALLKKLKHMAERGSEEGERKAAHQAMTRIIEKYGLDIEVEDITEEQQYRFKYSSKLENMLLARLLSLFTERKTDDAFLDTHGVREIVIKLNREEYIKLEASYQYFRAHMRTQWNKVCMPLIKKKRKPKTKAKLRNELYIPFFTRYIIASKLDKGLEFETREIQSQDEAKQVALMNGVKGGTYNTQLSNGLLLDT